MTCCHWFQKQNLEEVGANIYFPLETSCIDLTSSLVDDPKAGAEDSDARPELLNTDELFNLTQTE